MDRDELVKRNKQLTDAFHQPPVQHRVRRYLVELISRFPFSPLTKGWNRVLFIRPDHLGDMLLATPAMRALKDARPYTEIHVLAAPWNAAILSGIPEIDQVLTIEFPGFKRGGDDVPVYAPYLQAFNVGRQLRKVGYGHAIIMRPDHWWGAMVAHIAGISERIGYDLTNVAPFLTQALPFEHTHVVRQNMTLVAGWTDHIDDADVPYYLEVYDKERIEIANLLKTFSIDESQPIFCIHPGAGTWVKQWETARWAKVADTLIDQLDAQVVFTGGDHERGLVDDVLNRMDHSAYTTAGDLSIEQLAALYERSLVVLGPDSGPLHIAAAVSTPTVALYGPADPVEFGTWGAKTAHVMLTSPIGCRPCRVLDWGDDDPDYHPCLRDISIGQVLEAARRVVNENQA